MRSIGKVCWLVIGAMAVVLAGCMAPVPSRPVSASVVEAMNAPAGDSYAQARAPMALQFPRDHGPHPGYRTEWWYYTGNLTGPDGGQYGYQLTFFRTALAPELPARASTLATNQIYMAHFALTDGPRQTHEAFDRYSRGAGGLAGATSDPSYRVWVEDWNATEVEPGVTHLQAAAAGQDGPVAIDLTLRETRLPVAHGNQGLHQKGPEPGNASYYYSLVGLDTTGTITSAGQTIPVTGLSWMDHEFGTSALSGAAVGWDWFSLQLDNGAALMLYTIRTADGSPGPAVTGTLLWPDGSLPPHAGKMTITGTDFTVDPTGTWTSPTTGIAYPSGWQIALPALDIRLDLQPLVPDQEMDVNFVYWEGAVQATGQWQGQPVTGRGYVELTGYGE